MWRSKKKRTFDLRVNVKTELDTKVLLSDQNTSSGCTYNMQSRRQEGDNSGSKYTGYRKCCNE